MLWRNRRFNPDIELEVVGINLETPKENMRTVALAALFALCTLTVSTQTANDDLSGLPSNYAEVGAQMKSMKDKRLFLEYDKFNEYVTIGAYPDGIISECSIIRFKDGLTRNSLTFEKVVRDWSYRETSAINVLADGQRLFWTSRSRHLDLTVNKFGVWYIETIFFEPTDEQYNQLFGAKKVELQINEVEFVLPTKTKNLCSTIYRLAKTLKK